MFIALQGVFALSKDPIPNLKSAKVQYIENKNQWEEFIRYQADFRGGKIFLENNRFTYVFYHPDDIQSLHPHEGKQISKVRLHALKVHAIGGNKSPNIVATDSATYHHNYFKGNNPSKWASDVRLFSAVTYQNIYANIDLKFYSHNTDIKYDLIIHPQGNASAIALKYDGVTGISIHDEGLLMKLSVGNIAEQKPYAYQLINGVKQEVMCNFTLKNNTVGFQFPRGYNKNFQLVIDPTLIFSSYSGSSADNWGFTATYDDAGNAYAGGNVNAVGYPVTAGAYDLNYHGGNNMDGNRWVCDMAIAKFNSTGTALLYATYLGGSSNEQPQSLIVDGNDNLIILGTTYSNDFPVTSGAFQASYNGNSDIVISKLSTNGNVLIASTYVGGTENDGLNVDPGFAVTGPLKYNYSDDARGEIMVDPSNNIIVGSCSRSTDFPTTSGVFQPLFSGGLQDGVIFKINPSLTSMVWSSYLGGTNDDAVYDVTIDNSGNLYLAGGTNSVDFPVTPGTLNPVYQGGRSDGFISRISNNGSSILTSTYIGTASYDQTYFIELDYSGNVYTTGQTEGTYPVTPGVYSNPNSKQFIHKVNPGLSSTIYSTVFGSGSLFPNISPTAFLVDSCENVYVAGWGRCLSLGVFTAGDVNGMPVTPNAFQPTTTGCDFYFFVLNYDAASLLYATYFGGINSAEHVDGGTSRFNKNGTIYESVCAGCGGSNDFPTTPGVVSNTNNSPNCNNGIIKLAFNLSTTVSVIAVVTPDSGCAPLTLTFENNSSNAESYVWNFDDGSPLDTSFAPTHTYTDTGVYHVMLVALNPFSCNRNDTSYATIVVSSGNTISATFDFLQYSPCDTTAVAQFTGTGGHVYEWNFGDGYYASGMNASHQYTDTGTYNISLIVSDTVCNVDPDTLSQPVTFHPDVHASVIASGPVEGCAPLSVSFINNSTTYGIHYWNFMDGSPLDTSLNPTHIFATHGIYNSQFVVQDSFSCNVSDTSSVLITVHPSLPLSASFNLSVSHGCDTLNVQTHFNGLGGNTYHWFFGDGNQSFGLDAEHRYAQVATYLLMLVVEDTVCNRQDTARQLVSILPTLNVGINSSNANSGCAPNPVMLSSSFAVNGSYEWHFGDGTVSFNPTVFHVYREPGVYIIQLMVTDSASCNVEDTSSFIIHVFPKPIAGFTYNKEEPLFINTDIRFYNQSLNASTYNWNFGDGSLSNDSIFSHQFKTGGFHTVCLYATSQNNCIDTSCARLEIFDSEMIYVPNVFTPNGDGVNDEFKVYHEGITSLELLIFNRWGVKIFEIHSLDGSWDGKYNGALVPNQVYIWYLKAHGNINGSIEKMGRVTVIK